MNAKKKSKNENFLPQEVIKRGEAVMFYYEG